MIPKQFAHLPIPEGAQYYGDEARGWDAMWYKLVEDQWYSMDMDPKSPMNYWSAVAGITRAVYKVSAPDAPMGSLSASDELWQIVAERLEQIKHTTGLNAGYVQITNVEESSFDGQPIISFVVDTSDPELIERLKDYSKKKVDTWPYPS